MVWCLSSFALTPRWSATRQLGVFRLVEPFRQIAAIIRHLKISHHIFFADHFAAVGISSDRPSARHEWVNGYRADSIGVAYQVPRLAVFFIHSEHYETNTALEAIGVCAFSLFHKVFGYWASQVADASA
jgi:hypothetical protein